MAIKLADTLAPMGDFDVAEAQHIGFADGENLQEKYDNGQLGGGGASYTQLSQEEYDALSDDEKLNGKEYRTYDTGHIYKRGVEYGKDVDTGTKGLRSNSQYFKIDITKGSESWNGTAKFSFNNGTTPTEITFMITADKVYYIITEGVNCIKSVTYTFNSANVVIGVELNGVVYGTQMVEMNSTFGTINSLTNEQFTGATTAIFKVNNTDPYACTEYKVLTGTEDLFTLPCGHYVSDKVNTAYNYPITDTSNVTAHIYVLGCLNDPANNKGYRIILYFDNKGRMYRINEWWGSFSNGWQEIATKTYTDVQQLGLTKVCSVVDIYKALPINSEIICASYGDANHQGGYITDVPSGHGVLEIKKSGYDGCRATMTFTESATNSTGYKRKWIAEFPTAPNNLTADKIIWHEIAYKTVADVGFTTINQTDGLTAPTGITMTDSSKVNYCIRNGICYVHIALQISSISAKVNSWTTIAELPKSVIEAVGAMNCESNTVPECMPIRVSQAGKLTLMYKGTTTSTSDWWSYSFSYPVTE